MKAEDGIPGDVDVYIATLPGKPEISIAAVAFNSPSCAEPFGRELKGELNRLAQANGASELMTDSHGAFISFVTGWPEEGVKRVFTGIASKLNVSVSIDLVSDTVANKLHQGRR